MSRIIAAIDNSITARPALAAATSLARILGSDVQAIHVAEDGDDLARTCAESMGVPFVNLAGDPLEQIVEAAAADDVVGVAVGARQRLSDHHIGHLARALASQIDKPVLVVPPEAAPPDGFRTVLIAMEGTPATARSVKPTIEVAVGADLEVVVVHVDDETSIPSFSDQVAHETDAYAREFLARYVPGAPMARLELRIGVPADEILTVAASIGADLLAVGWPQSNDPARGPVVRELLDRSPVPVLLVALAETPVTDLTDSARHTVMR